MTDQTIQIADIARTQTPFPSILATRTSGKRFWEALQTYLSPNHEAASIHLSFAGVDVMDASFADEVFGSLATKRGRKTNIFCPIVLINLNETCLENLSMALETRPDREPVDQERLRNCVLPHHHDNTWELIGKYEEHVRETFQALQQTHTLTARDLADHMSLGLSAASTRLKILADLGLAHRLEIRDAQGKQFVYRRLS